MDAVDDRFCCGICHGVFDKVRSDDDAKKELEEIFPGFEPQDCGIVCDACFRAMGFADSQPWKS